MADQQNDTQDDDAQDESPAPTPPPAPVQDNRTQGIDLSGS